MKRIGYPKAKLTAAIGLAVSLAACSDSNTAPETAAVPANVSSAPAQVVAQSTNPERNAYFGDLHVHTMYSFDAFIFGTTSSPDEAYEFAKGDTIVHPAGFPMTLDRPLDFYGVSDHAFYLGVMRQMADPNTEISKHEAAEGMTSLGDGPNRNAKFQRIISFMRSDRGIEIIDPEIGKNAWGDIIAAANRHNDPGKFTAFIAYEYTSSSSDRGNLHRNVIFRGDTAPERPFSRLDSTNPEDLWDWMDSNRGEGFESLAIPHNSNGSNGRMFSLLDWAGNPLDSAYASQRMRNEPLIEITQVKGTSDTHPALSPNDEWADFEIMPYRIATMLQSEPNGSYIRQAYLNGLSLQDGQGFNPFKFGVIGSSDTHNATYAGDEDDYWSKVGLRDSSPLLRGSVPLETPNEDGSEYALSAQNTWGASGLAGVWAEENTRGAIYDAFRRKETFGTTGPRMKVRFFAGYNLPSLDDPALVSKAYEGGVTMGADLIAEQGNSPEFIAWVARDAMSAPLQRLQIIKGWVEGGEAQERVIDVACSGGIAVDPATNRCPDNGAKVNLSDCSISSNIGEPELMAKWRDPQFDASQNAFYYVRAMENPTCRWSTWDAIRAGVEPRPDMASTLQERVWSSPIWVTPAN
jgi:hypothetical protein